MNADQRLSWYLALIESILTQALRDVESEDTAKVLRDFRRRVGILDRLLRQQASQKAGAENVPPAVRRQ